MTSQTLIKKFFSLTCQIPLQMPIGKSLFFSSRNDLDLGENADSPQKCEKILLAFYVTTKSLKRNGSSVFVFEVIVFTFTFFVPLREQWSKTLSPANIAQKNFALLSSLYALLTFCCGNTSNDMNTRKRHNFITYGNPRGS